MAQINSLWLKQKVGSGKEKCRENDCVCVCVCVCVRKRDGLEKEPFVGQRERLFPKKRWVIFSKIGVTQKSRTTPEIAFFDVVFLRSIFQSSTHIIQITIFHMLDLCGQIPYTASTPVCNPSHEGIIGSTMCTIGIYLLLSHNFSIIIRCPEQDSNLGSKTLCYLVVLTSICVVYNQVTGPPGR